MIKKIMWSLVVCAAVSLPAFAAGPTYQLAQKYVLGGEGAWDYLTYDGNGKRLFVSRGSHVMVADPANGTVLGDIPGTGGVHGIAVVPSMNKGFTSNGRDNTVTVFDFTTLKTLATVAVPAKNPDAIIYDPTSKRIFTFGGASPRTIVAIDAQTNAIVGSTPIVGKPEFAAVDGRGNLYLNMEDTSEIAVVDTVKNSVKGILKTQPACDEPVGMAIDVPSNRIFVGCGGNNVLAVYDVGPGNPLPNLVSIAPIGAGSDAIGFDPATKLVFSSNGRDGTLTVVHEDSPNTYTVVGNFATQFGARTLAVDPGTHNVYLVTSEFDVTPTPVPSGQPPRTMRPGTFTLLVMSPK